jgi:putative component of toxin-antitoxin plasmid stabilization module
MSASKDYTGQKIGMLKVIKRKRENNRTYYYCKCDCGNEDWIRAETLKSQNPSCGCAGRFKPKDITSMRFEKLLAIKPTNKRDKNNGAIIWEFRCDCGKKAEYSLSVVTKGAVVSCGCVQKATRQQNMSKAIEKHLEEHIVDDTNILAITRDKPISSNTSGITGVIWDGSRSKWKAQIEFKKKKYHLGRYDTIEEAAKVRRIAEDKLFGDFIKWYNEEYKKTPKK